MARVQIDAAELAQLKVDAKLTRTMRAARLDGAVLTLSRPMQFVKIDVDGSKVQLVPNWQTHRDAIQAAFTAALSAGPVALVEAAVAEEPPKGA